MRVLLLVAVVLFMSPNGFAQAQVNTRAVQAIRKIDFEGYSESTKKKIFYGSETLFEAKGFLVKETKYFSLTHQLVYKDRTAFQKSGFGMLEFNVDNLQTGYKLFAKYDSVNKRYSIETVERSGAKKKLSAQSAEKPLIVPKALQEVVVQQWESMLKKPFELDLFIPSKQTVVGFQLKLAKKDKIADVKLMAQSWLFRMFVPDISFQFSVLKNRPVTKYSGPSLFSIEGKDSGKIFIIFKQQNTGSNIKQASDQGSDKFAH